MKKHILIAICGMSPAVITETVYALSDDPPDMINVITTKLGHAAIVREIFDSRVWDALMRQPRFMDKKISFSPGSNHIRLLPNAENSGEAEDIISNADTKQTTDFILNVLRQYTENPDTRITLSIAGGRKTMGAAGALCMSLLGRSQDVICHVLVNTPFDNPNLNPKFYFPVAGQIHSLPDGTQIASEAARLELSLLPFVRCRHLFENHLQRLPGDYSNMVSMANRAVDDLPELRLIPDNLECFIGMQEVKLPLLEYLLYWMLAERRAAGENIIEGSNSLHEEYMDFIDQLDTSSLPQKLLKRKDELLTKDSEDLRRPVSNISAILRKLLSETICDNFLPTRAKGHYGLMVDGNKIKIGTSVGHP